MSSIDEIKASEFIEEDPTVALTSDNLTQVRNKLDEENLRAIPVVKDEEDMDFAGVVGYRDLIRFIQFNPEDTKLSKVMHQPPEIDADDSLVELCNLRINSGRKMLVRLDDDKLKGVVSDRQFLEAFKMAEELEHADLEDLMVKDLHQVYEDTTVEQARHVMLDENISRLPVTDKDGNLVGFLRSTTVLRTMIKRERMNAGGTSGGRSGEEIKTAGGGERTQMSEITVDEIMNRTPPMVEDEETGSELAEKMLREGSNELLVTENNKPQGLLTAKDLIDFVYSLRTRDTILVNITGAESDTERNQIHSAVQRQVQGSLGRNLRKPEELTVKMKSKNKEGNQRHYEVRTTLYSELGRLEVKEDGWNLRNIMDESLEKLDRRVRDEKQKLTEH